MKYPARRFKSLAVALKEIEPFVRDGQHLETGKPFKQLEGMRSREVLANLMVCLAYNFATGEKLSFCSDPIGGDGIIYDESSKETWQTEHVMVASFGSNEADDSEKAILEQILEKNTKGGAEYARGKTLIVFLNSKGQKWYPNRVARQLPDPLHFDTVWVVGLQKFDDGEYIYAVTNLDLEQGRDAPAFHVRVKADFESWEVTRFQ
ncbi:hypothetical protein [Bradyrhizobium yuanmingense]|uniref:hypothetical protein n=1 Tax=Bradyrhizobium yuanmingense TaxID=108015 RepID=UPI000561397F|nr:hypothetical protein [Bradyrhizobium yuanmingense]